MSTWTDDRIETALAGLIDAVDLDRPAVEDPAGREWRLRRPGRTLLAASAVLLVVAAVVLATPGARRAVADWFGFGTITFERSTDPSRVGTVALLDDTTPVDVDDAVRALDLPLGRLATAGLGRPSDAARPIEGGVVLAWSDRSLTLWVVGVDEALQLDKRFPAEVDVAPVPDLGDDAVLVDGPHDLFTPVRVIAAERVLWWLDGDRQYRLEGDLPADELVAIARAITG